MKATTLSDARRRWLCLILTGALVSAAVALLPPVHAADEDTQASVYLVFDPETGEFVTMHDTEGTANARETQEAIESVAEVGEIEDGGAATAAPDAPGGSSTNPTLIAGLVVAAIAVIGAAVFLQRSRSSA